MIKIKLIKETNGKEIVKGYEKIYGSIDRLKRIVKRNPNDKKAYYDLDDWKYFKVHLDEKVKETDVLNKENFTFSKIEIDILDAVKNKHPSSISELAKFVNRKSGNILDKVYKLEKEGFVNLKSGAKNKKTPVLKYDKIEIII